MFYWYPWPIFLLCLLPCKYSPLVSVKHCNYVIPFCHLLTLSIVFFAEHKSLIWMSLNLTFFYPKVFIQVFILKNFLYPISQRFFFLLLIVSLFMFRSLISLRFISVVVLVKIQFYFSPYKEPPFPIWPAKPPLMYGAIFIVVYDILYICGTLSHLFIIFH